MFSPFVVDFRTNGQAAAQHVVEFISRTDGRSLRRAMATAVHEIASGVAHCYTPIYKGGNDLELDINSLRRFIAKF